MFIFFKKKTIKIKNKLVDFVHKNLVQIIIIGGTFIFLQLIKSFPYINIIPGYQYLVIGFMLFLAAIFFGSIFTNKNILTGALILFAIAPVMIIFEMKVISELLGFVIFMLITITLRQVIIDRKEFKKETNE